MIRFLFLLFLVLSACVSNRKQTPPSAMETGDRGGNFGNMAPKPMGAGRSPASDGVAGGGSPNSVSYTVATEAPNSPKKTIKPKKPAITRQRLDTAGFRHGKLVYDIPDTMQYKKEYHVVARIHRDRNCLFIYEGLSNPKDGLIRTGDVMEVTLTDPTKESFVINKVNEGSQLIDTLDYTEWVFHVKPIRSGTLELFLVASIISNGAKRDIVHQSVVYVKSDVAKVASEESSKFLTEHWKWLLTALVIPFVIFLINRRKKNNPLQKEKTAE